VRGSVGYLGLADFLLIAEAVPGIPAEELAHVAKLDLAESALTARRRPLKAWSSIQRLRRRQPSSAPVLSAIILCPMGTSASAFFAWWSSSSGTATDGAHPKAMNCGVTKR